MRGDLLAGAHHVLRHCRKGDLKTEADGSISGVFPDAFEPDEDGISVNWLEIFAGHLIDQIAMARLSMSRGRELRLSHRLAKLNVGAIHAVGSALNKVVSTVHDPIDAPPDKINQGHSLIKGVVLEDDDLRNRIANIVLPVDLYSAKV